MTTNNLRASASRASGVTKRYDAAATGVGALQNPVTAVAGAGSSLATGTAISANPGVVKFTGADGTVGATLPPSAGSSPIPIRNPDATNAAKVYPNTSTGVINNGSAGAALSIPANTACVLYPLDGSDNWFSVPRVPS